MIRHKFYSKTKKRNFWEEIFLRIVCDLSDVHSTRRSMLCLLNIASLYLYGLWSLQGFHEFVGSCFTRQASVKDDSLLTPSVVVSFKRWILKISQFVNRKVENSKQLQGCRFLVRVFPSCFTRVENVVTAKK